MEKPTIEQYFMRNWAIIDGLTDQISLLANPEINLQRKLNILQNLGERIEYYENAIQTAEMLCNTMQFPYERACATFVKGMTDVLDDVQAHTLITENMHIVMVTPTREQIVSELDNIILCAISHRYVRARELTNPTRLYFN